jgi:ATP-binding cassette subfamily F protein 3
MLNAHAIGISFGGTTLFSDLSFKLVAGDRVGLIGKNGAGKTTLLSVIAGEQEYDDGSLAFEKGTTVGYLKQDIDFQYGRTVLEETYSAFTELLQLEKKIQVINEGLSSSTDFESEQYKELLHQLDLVNHRYEILGGFQYKGETEKVLLGLGFERSDFGKMTDTFSGGWRMRIELAKLLLQKNPILLLDEPTNHLDIESIIWLEKFLVQYPGSIILVSHDKMFLGRVTNRTMEISLGGLYDYKLPYSEFQNMRADIREKQAKAKKNQDKAIKHTEQLIEKFRYKASKAAFAQSLIKKLEKVERIEVDAKDQNLMKVRFPMSVKPGKVVIEGSDLAKAYGEHLVFEKVNLLVERGSRIAFVGQNGQGKTTLARMIVGEIEYSGELKLGHNVHIGYFAQNQAEYLDEKLTVLETMLEASSDSNRTRVRDMLGAFLFSGEEVDKKVGVLSGGERNRLALCKLLLTPFNVLVMDEPTNHLDIPSKNVLKTALQHFEGTLILVSHDREFLQGLSSRVYEFRKGAVKEYLGDIDYFLEIREVDDLREIERKDLQRSEQTDRSGRQAFEEKRKKDRVIRKLRKELNQVEKEIASLEQEIMHLDAQIFEEAVGVADNPDFFSDYQEKKNRLDDLMASWESLERELDNQL